MTKSMRILASLMIAAPLFSQARSASSFVQASARIVRPDQYARSNGYDPATEVRLSGVVEQASNGRLMLRMAFGVVSIELGPAGTNLLLRAGQPLQVVASKVMNAGSQRLLAREVRAEAGVIQLRDSQGLPLEEVTQG